MRWGWLAIVGCAALPACTPYAETYGYAYSGSYAAPAPVYPYGDYGTPYVGYATPYAGYGTPYAGYGTAVAVPVIVPERRRFDFDRGERRFEGGYRAERFVPRDRADPGRGFPGSGGAGPARFAPSGVNAPAPSPHAGGFGGGARPTEPPRPPPREGHHEPWQR